VRSVVRHDIDREHCARAVKRLVSRWHESVEDIETERLGPELAMERAFREFAHRCAADPRAAANETWFAQVRALQAGAALFLTATRPEGEVVEFRFGEDTIRRPATGPTGDNDAPAWLKAMYLAIISRDRPRAELLAAVPVDLVRATEPRHGEIVFSWIRALQLHTLGGGDLIDTVLDAMRTENVPADGPSPEWVRQVHGPVAELFYLYTQREKGRFTESLYHALELHKQYWTAQEDAARQQEGFVALGPLAIACLAHDAGMPIDVESDYLPHHLLVGTWVGETST
jgi:hypothetical protein